jgi:hypothetical protein
MLDSAFWGDHFPVKNKNIRKKLRKFSMVKNIFKNNAPKRRCVDFVLTEVLERDYITKPDNGSYNLTKTRQGTIFYLDEDIFLTK